MNSESNISDKAILHQFGYTQQLLRDMGGFSNFAVSFSVISILTGAVTLYGQGLTSGGPVVMGIGWPLVTLFVLCISASMAELASAIPTSGALYHWASLLGGSGWGWITAWLNLIGLVATVAGIDYGAAQFLAPLVNVKDTPLNLLWLFGLIVLSQAIMNHIGIRVVARLNNYSAIYHIAGVAVIVVALLLFAPKQPVAFLFTKTFTTITDKPYWICFLSGLLQAQWTYTGYDASAHTIEETRDARVRAPWGIYLSVAVSGFFGYIMLALVTLSIKDLGKTAAASNPFTYIFEQALGGTFSHVITWIVTIAMWFCGLACVTSTSRMIFAFARDNGLPGSRCWGTVSKKYRTPANAVWLGSFLAVSLPVVILAIVRMDADKMGKLYPAVTGISTVALYISYGLPLMLKAIAIRQGRWTSRTDGPWSLGNWSLPILYISLVWIALISVLFVLPPNDLTGYIFGGTLGVLAVLYMLTAKGKFRGPIPQAESEEAILEMEAEFEQSSLDHGR